MKINKLPKEILTASIDFGLLSKNDQFSFSKITEGVSSDIWHVSAEKKEFCIKRALGKLTVKEDWFAPINRNNYEAKYFLYCKDVIPNSFPKVLGHDNKKFILAMEWYDNEKFINFKKKLLAKTISLTDAKRVGKVLGVKHKFFYKKQKFKKIFLNDETFYAIRIEPYLVFTSRFYPELSSYYKNIIEFLNKNKSTLIHGDFSPKNILIGKNYPIILDAETACWGNPIFDLAFFNNHLILKSILNDVIYRSYLELSKYFLEAYFAHFSFIKNRFLIEKFIILQSLLILARVDGKSPVEYFSKKHKDKARSLAKIILKNKNYNLNSFFQNWENVVKT